MDLAQLKFVVDTSELKNASAEIEKLTVAVSKLDKPMRETSQSASNLSKQYSEVDKTSSKTVESTKKQTTVLERQQMILEFMTQGFSKGQASQLAYAKAAGALTNDLEQLGKVLQTQRTLMGTDPFDKSIGALQSLRNEYTVIKEVQRLYNADLGLTKSQMEDLAREKLRLIEKFKLEGKSLSEVKAGLIELNSAYIKNASSENAIAESMKNRQKAANDASKANQYIIAELDRVNRLTSSNGEITSATNSKLIAFEKALRLSGMSADEQVSKLAAYKKSLESIQKAAGNRQVDYLSRALGPQITDIFVGLATGQSPMMVLLQQGGQLRDQFALAGVAGKDMGKMLTQAAATMVTSVKDIALAVGGLLVNSFTSLGKTVVDAGIAPFKLMGAYIRDMIDGTTTASKSIADLQVAFAALGKVGIVALITAAITAVIAMKDLVKEQRDAAKMANLFGGELGLTTNNLYAQAQAFAGAEGNVGKYVSAIGIAAKAGVGGAENIKAVTDAMIALNKVGISADETASRFAKLGEKPAEGLREFAKESGMIAPSVLQVVRMLEEQGRKSEAVAIATRAMSDAMVDASSKIQNEQGAILSIFDALASGAKKMWDAILNIGRPDSLENRIKQATQDLARATSGDMAWYERFGRSQEDAIAYYQEILTSLQNQAKKEKEVSDEKRKQSEYADWETRNAQALTKSLSEKERFALKQSELQRDLNAGIITQVEYTKALAGWKTIIFGKDESYQRLLKQAGDFYLNQAGAVQNLTKAEIALNQVRQSEEWKKLNAAQQKEISNLYEAAAANERLKKAEEDRKTQLAYIARLTGQADKMGAEYYSGLKRLDEALTDGNISMSEYIDLLDKLYRTTSSFKAFQGIESAVTKSITDVNAQRESIQAQYGMDFATDREKTRLTAEATLRKQFAESQAALDKNLADAKAKLNDGEYQKAEALYIKEADLKKQLAQEVYDRQIYMTTDAYKRQEGYSKAFEGLFTGMADAIVEFAKTGKLSFSGLVDTMVADLIRFEMRMQMMNLYSAMGGGKGILSALGLPTFADGGAFSGGVQKFAKGGTFTNSVVSSPTLFKFAKGTGLMGEAGPEAIMPLTRDSSGRLGVQASGSGSNVSVQVINNTNTQASTNETIDSKGNRRIEVVIGDMTAGEISRSGSASQKSIKSTFGLQPQLIRR